MPRKPRAPVPQEPLPPLPAQPVRGGNNAPAPKRAHRTTEAAPGKPAQLVSARARAENLPCWREVRERICWGMPLADLAGWVQQERGYWRTLSLGQCVYALECAREAVPLADRVALRLPGAVVRAEREFNDRLEDLRRLEALYQVLWYQMERGQARERERRENDPALQGLAMRIADIVGRMHGIKMDLGLTGVRELGTLTLDPARLHSIEQRYGPGAAAALADPATRERILGVVQHALRLAQRPDLCDAIPIPGRGGVIDVVAEHPTDGDPHDPRVAAEGVSADLNSPTRESAPLTADGGGMGALTERIDVKR
jgi:hypothetical protein